MKRKSLILSRKKEKYVDALLKGRKFLWCCEDRRKVLRCGHKRKKNL